MKTFSLALAAAAFLLTPVQAQERSAGGAHEVQASFSALKIAVAQAQADAFAAKEKANEAMKLAEKIRECSKYSMFFDDKDPKANGKGCVESMNTDDADGRLAASLEEKDFDDEVNVRDFAKQGAMMLDLTCVASSGGKTLGSMITIPGNDGRRELGYRCENTSDQSWQIDFGVGANSWKTVYSGTVRGFGPAKSKTITSEWRSCVNTLPVNRQLFVKDGTLFQGSTIITPAGTRVVGKKQMMSAPDWNGKIRMKNCNGVGKATYYKD